MPLEDIYDWDENWEWLEQKYEYLQPSRSYEDGFEPKALREFLNKEVNLSDDTIWQAHIELCDEKIDEHKKEIVDLEKRKQKNKLKLQVIRKLGNIPSKDELDRLLRYEGAIERQLYKAVNQLERLQRLRAGDNVPPTDLTLNET
jgi:CRISPR/Cas system-associated endonuclease Cas1